MSRIQSRAYERKRRTEKRSRTADSRPEPTILLYPPDMCQGGGNNTNGSVAMFC
jgi:hypothetical protein